MLLLVVRGLFVACALSGFGAALFALTMPIARDVNSRLHASTERQVGKIMSLSLVGALICARSVVPPSRQFCLTRGSGKSWSCRLLRLRAH